MSEIMKSPLNQVDDLIQKALDQDDIDIVLVEINRMIEAKELVGKVLAKTLYLLNQNYYRFSISEQERVEDILGAINVKPDTMKRYLRVWKYMDELPQSFQDGSIRNIVPIANALDQGYDISDEHWEKLERASSLHEIQRIVTVDVKEAEPRKSGIHGYLNNGDGSLYCWCDGERGDVGYLDIHSTNEAVQKFINRIVNNTGIELK